MKKLIIALIFMSVAFMPTQTKAQLSVSLNIGSQPLWGPVGYNRVDYYYLPDIEAYYYVPQRQFIYLSNGRWIFSASLPPRYSNYDLYSGYKVVVNTPKPYLSFKEDKIKYVKYKNIHTQPVIAKSNDPKYYGIKGHPKNPHGTPPAPARKMTSESKGNDNGNGKGNDNGKGKDNGNGKGNEKGKDKGRR